MFNRAIFQIVVIAMFMFSTAVKSEESELDAMDFKDHYKFDIKKIEPSFKSYDIPLKEESIINRGDFKQFAGINSRKILDQLKKKGFWVVSEYRYDKFYNAYNNLKTQSIPVYITADCLLHYFHIFFDHILMMIEKEFFYDDLLDLIVSMQTTLEKNYHQESNVPGYQLALDYLTILGSCLDPEYKSAVSNDVSKELQLIQQHQGFHLSPIFKYQDDYSQFKPRGHYTKSKALNRYFMAMMYMGRRTFLLNGGEPHGQFHKYLVSEVEAKRQTCAAMFLTQALMNATMPDGRSTLSVWLRIYNITCFFVGYADNLTPMDYREILSKKFNQLPCQWVNDQKKYNALKTSMNERVHQNIFSGTGNIGTVSLDAAKGTPNPEILSDALMKTSGLRLMGQRFILDSYIMGKLVFPTVGGPPQSGKPFTYGMTAMGPRRVFPRGLDVLSVLGNQRAAHWLEVLGDSSYSGYKSSHNKLRLEIRNEIPLDPTENLYQAWLHALKTFWEETESGYPYFMLTNEWKDREISSSLASWTELRHDTILYAKQSYTMIGRTSLKPKPQKTKLFLEVYPKLYERLSAAIKMMKDTLFELELLSPQQSDQFVTFYQIMQRAGEISRSTLKNREVDEESKTWLKELPNNLKKLTDYVDADDRVTMVADVHTDANTESVLEEATGYLDAIYVCIPDGKDEFEIYKGYIFNHYEFKQPMEKRLTDDEWRQMIQKGDRPKSTDWSNNYSWGIP